MSETADLSRKTVAAATLGCKVNAYDTESVLELFRGAGYTVVNFNEPADIYIINTCTVTAVSDKKSRQKIRGAVKSGGIVVVMGCLPQKNLEEVRKIEGVNIVLGTSNRADVPALVENYRAAGGIADGVKGYNISSGPFENLPVKGLYGKTRALVKIQDGCDNFCSYCIVPYVRGRSRSRKIIDIREEITALAERGVKEIVLTGICASSYGKDLGGLTLVDAIKCAAEINGIERVRLSSIDISCVTPEFLRIFVLSAPSVVAKLQSHLHLSLQAGCDKTLRNMNRKYTKAMYKEAVDSLRAARADAAITTDIIVGFPGETEEDFDESFEFVREMGFAELHVFPFSAREGTKAFDMPQKTQKSVIAARAARMLSLGEELKSGFRRKHSGKVYPVLFESLAAKGDNKGKYRGYTTNYIEVFLASDEDIRGRIIEVKLGADEDARIQSRYSKTDGSGS